MLSNTPKPYTVFVDWRDSASGVTDTSEFLFFCRNKSEAMKKAAEDFNCSEATAKSWRYGYRQPSIAQAKHIIKVTEGRLDFESIYGSISDILKEQE